MKEPLFIEHMLKRGKEAEEKVTAEFASLTHAQLNWKPNPENWSIAQCLDHLVVSDMQYFPVLKKIAEKEHHMSAWEKWNPASGLLGKMLVTTIGEQVTKKVKAPPIFLPDIRKIDLGILDRFQKHLDTMLEYFSTYKDKDLDKIKITSPVSKYVTYSLRHGITILIQHEHRHINQGLRLKKLAGFPA